MHRMQRMKKQLVRIREKFMLSVVSFDEKTRILKPKNKIKSREQVEKNIRLFPILSDQKLLTSLGSLDAKETNKRRIYIKHRVDVNIDQKLGLKTLREKISRRIFNEENNQSGLHSINSSQLIPYFRINCLPLKKFSENRQSSNRLHKSLKHHQSQYSLRSGVSQSQKLTTAEMESTLLKNGAGKRFMNIGINIKPQGRIMIRRKISIAPWTNEQQFQKCI